MVNSKFKTSYMPKFPSLANLASLGLSRPSYLLYSHVFDYFTVFHYNFVTDFAFSIWSANPNLILVCFKNLLVSSLFFFLFSSFVFISFRLFQNKLVIAALSLGRFSFCFVFWFWKQQYYWRAWRNFSHLRLWKWRLNWTCCWCFFYFCRLLYLHLCLIHMDFQ